MADLSVPVQIPPQSLEINIVHRFFRATDGDFPDNFITFANVNLALRYVILNKLEVGTGYLLSPSLPKEYALYAAYSYFLPQIFLRTQAYVQLFGTQTVSGDSRSWRNNGLYQINLQSEPIAKRFFPTVNFIFDGLTKKFGIGTGIDISVLETYDIVAEYFPVIGARDIDQMTQNEKVNNCFSIGFKKSTAGHHFIFSVSNNTDLGVRRLMRGSTTNNIYFGFNIQRLISL
jgi:hypothetical protein